MHIEAKKNHKRCQLITAKTWFCITENNKKLLLQHVTLNSPRDF